MNELQHTRVSRHAIGRVMSRALTRGAACALLAACGDDSLANSTPSTPKGIVVLDGYIQPGLTLLADTGTASSRITFAPGTEFDAGAFELLRDTVLAVSSRAAGDLLYIADLRAGTMRRLQMPARSNPGGARLLRGSGGQTLIGVALRDSGSVALVSVAGTATPTSTRLSGAGRCPTDLFQYDNATWVVDANADCAVDYTIRGDVRLIRIPNSGSVRDTIVMTGMRGSSASAIVTGDVAYVSAGGDARFATFPYTLVSSGVITKVDLKNRRVQTTRTMPANSYGAGLKLGADGFLYVSLYEDLTAFRDRIVKLRADDLSVITTPLGSWQVLLTTAGAEQPCSSAVADAQGRVHCLVTGAGSATSLLVFDTNGREVRRVAAGQGGVDLAIR